MRQAGIQGILKKPYDSETLTRTLEKIFPPAR